MKITLAILIFALLALIIISVDHDFHFPNIFDYDYLQFVKNLWMWFKKIFFFPGDLLLKSVSYVFGIKFLFDLAHEGYRIFASGTISIIFWVIFGALALDAYGAISRYCKKSF